MKRIKSLEGEEKEDYFEGKTAGMSEQEKYNFMMQIALGFMPILRRSQVLMLKMM